MNMPGFTAEASLHATTQHYKLLAGWAEGAASRAVIPQQKMHCTFCRIPVGEEFGWQWCCRYAPALEAWVCWTRRCAAEP
jgi:hypothetical protein